MTTETLQYLTINDFSQGIRHRSPVGESIKGAPGAADPLTTFRCIALPAGGIGPLPKMVESYTRIWPGGDPTDGTVRISGFHVAGPTQELDNSSEVAGVDNCELHFAYEWHEATVTPHRWWWERWHIWDAGLNADTIKNQSVSHPATYAEIYRPTAFVDARMHDTDPAELGDIFVVAGWHPDDMDSTDNMWLIFPDPTSPTLNGTQAILTTNETTIMVQHQGRVVSIDNHVFRHGADSYWIVNDQLVWTQVNLPTVWEDPPGTILGVGVFTQGPLSGYGAAASAGAQELLLVKHRGGATTISGDLDAPTVYSLPGVKSTQGAVTYGAFSPVGFIYGVKNGGIHAWGGGDSSEKLSTHLNDDFWDIAPADWKDFNGKFDIWNDYVLISNNWLYDTVTQSWWRIEDPAEYQIFQWGASPQSSMFYGVPIEYTDGGIICYRFDGNEKVSNYQWGSQYLPLTLDRVIDVREVSIRALCDTTGVSSVTLTLTNELDEVQVIAFDDIQTTKIPKLLRKQAAFVGSGMKVKVEANNTDGIAPVILEINLGYRAEQQEAFV